MACNVAAPSPVASTARVPEADRPRAAFLRDQASNREASFMGQRANDTLALCPVGPLVGQAEESVCTKSSGTRMMKKTKKTLAAVPPGRLWRAWRLCSCKRAKEDDSALLEGLPLSMTSCENTASWAVKLLASAQPAIARNPAAGPAPDLGLLSLCHGEYRESLLIEGSARLLPRCCCCGRRRQGTLAM